MNINGLIYGVYYPIICMPVCTQQLLAHEAYAYKCQDCYFFKKFDVIHHRLSQLL
ncbi:MAG: hypothetical protein K2X90_01620 [Candidatus Babeliaceae bacterium]|nr:hypothetical protein [Candidatus Babeliaceae bacterium]